MNLSDLDWRWKGYKGKIETGLTARVLWEQERQRWVAALDCEIEVQERIAYIGTHGTMVEDYSAVTGEFIHYHLKPISIEVSKGKRAKSRIQCLKRMRDKIQADLDLGFYGVFEVGEI